MNETGIIRLRGHHLCCLLTYVGAGPDKAFTGNIDRIAAQISSGRAVIQIVRGADDLCKPNGTSSCPWFERCEYKSLIEKRDRLMIESLNLMSGHGHWGIGSRRTLNEGMVWRFREVRRNGAFRDVCEGCAYEDLCTCVSTRGFTEVKLYPARPSEKVVFEMGGASCAM